MKYRYTKFTGDLLDEIDLEDLVSKLSDLLLSSGFGSPRDMDHEERTLQALHDAILEALRKIPASKWNRYWQDRAFWTVWRNGDGAGHWRGGGINCF